VNKECRFAGFTRYESKALILFKVNKKIDVFKSSVVDPDPYVFGPPGSGSVSQRYGSGSFYHSARKTLLLTVFDFLSLKNEVRVNVHSKG
jgi:hypothetical protein